MDTRLIDINELSQRHNWVYLRRIPFIKAGRDQILRFDADVVIRPMPRYAKAEETAAPTPVAGA